MTSRVIDTTRQHGVIGVTVDGFYPEPQQAPPVTLDEAMAAVAGWEREGMSLFGLHRIAQALRDEAVRLRASETRKRFRLPITARGCDDARADIQIPQGAGGGRVPGLPPARLG